MDMRSIHTVQLGDGYELYIIHREHGKKIILSLDKRSDGGAVRERITLEIPLDRAYRMAKYICGIIEMGELDYGDPAEVKKLEELISSQED